MSSVIEDIFTMTEYLKETKGKKIEKRWVECHRKLALPPILFWVMVFQEKKKRILALFHQSLDTRGLKVIMLSFQSKPFILREYNRYWLLLGDQESIHPDSYLEFPFSTIGPCASDRASRIQDQIIRSSLLLSTQSLP